MKATRLKQTTAAPPEEVSIDAVIASVISELENISSLKEEQRTALTAFLDGFFCSSLDRLWLKVDLIGLS